MSDGVILLGTRRYSSWSMRGWLAVRLAGLDVTEEMVVLGEPGGVGRRSPSGAVPFLRHRGAEVWESLAIVEYCAEQAPGLWPAERAARARARSIASEMHAGFRALRQAMPMVLGPDRAGQGRTAEALADIRRIEALWGETRAAFGAGGPFLFGAAFGAADAMYAPVVTRLLTYRPEIGAQTRAYCDAVRAHALVDEWYRAAAAEPVAWRIARHEGAE